MITSSLFKLSWALKPKNIYFNNNFYVLLYEIFSPFYALK